MIIGLLLMIVGILGKILSGTTSVTALIPLFFGLPITALGWFSQQNPKRAKLMQSLAAVVAVLGIIGTYGVIFDIFQADSVSAPLLSRSFMLLLCLLLLFLSGVWLVTDEN